jgi:drug/metabolite transporter (DMT)-like permease
MRYAGELAALGTALSWSVGSNLFAAAGQRMGSAVLNRLRISTAFVLLVLTLLIVRGAPWPTWATRPQLLLLGISGLIGFVFGDGWYFRSLVILGPGRASLLASTSPIFTTLVAWPLLHERPGPLALLGMALTVGGVSWVIGARGVAASEHREGSHAMGVLAGLLAALGQAVGYVFSRQALSSGIDPISATVVRVGAAVVAIWLIAAFSRAVPETLGALRDRGAAAFMAGGSFFGPFLGVTLSLTAIRYIPAGVASSITAIYPVFALLIAARFHGERVTTRALLGALVAVAGVIVLFLR